MLTKVDTGVKVEGLSHNDGAYIFDFLKPGSYNLVADAPGFKVVQLTNITVSIGEHISLPISLEIGSIDQTVVVSAESTSLLNSQSAAVGQTIDSAVIKQLPLDGRNFMQLIQLTTGASPVGGGNSMATTWTGRTDTSISLVGLRESDVSYLVNGIETRNARFGNVGIRPSVDAIQEFRVQRTTFGAEFGHSASVVNLTILGGSNRFHGDVFELNRNRDYAANDYFLNKSGLGRPPFNQNTFGGTIDGPVLVPKLYDGRNRSFFMFNYEGFRQVQGQVLTGIYPSAAQLAGNLADDSAGTGIYPLDSALCQQNPGSVKCANVVNPFTGQPYPGNVIPVSQLDPVDQKAIPYFAKPNVHVASSTTFPSYNTIATPSLVSNWNQYNARIDQTITSKDSLYATFSNSNESLFQPTLQPLGGKSFPLADHLWTITYAHVFSPNVINELRFGLNNSVTYLTPETAYGPNYASSLFRLTNTNSNPLTFGIPDFGISGISAVGSFQEAVGAQDNNYQYTDNVSASIGKHNLLFGLQFMHERYREATDAFANPGFNFDGRYTGTRASGFGLGDFLLGTVYQASGAVGDSAQNLHTNYYGPFIQDNWQVFPQLLLSLGLRYEYSGSPIESQNRSAYFDINTGQELIAGAGIRRSIINPDLTNFAPRIGFSWKPTFMKNAVVRGGFGLYYATDTFNLEQWKIVGSPFYRTQAINSNPTTPTLSMENMLPSFTASANLTPFTVDPNARTPYIGQWGLDVQQVLGGKYLVELEYAGGSGHYLPQIYNANAATIDPTGIIPIQQRSPYPKFGYILRVWNEGNSNYNAFTAKIERRYQNGLSFLGSYTYQKAIDEGDTSDFSATSRDFGIYDKGLSDYDVPHRFVASIVYELPIGRGKQLLGNVSRTVDFLIGGWQLNTITTLTTGQYSTARLPTDWLNIGSFSQSRPNIDPKLLKVGRGLPTQYFNPAAFTYPSTHIEGNAGRNTLEQPGYANWNSSLFKSFRVDHKVTTQLRFEAFNALNHTQFGFARTSVGPGFGTIGSARAPRVIQLGARIQW